VHQEPNRSGWGKHRRLSVPVAMSFAELDCEIPIFLRCLDERFGAPRWSFARHAGAARTIDRVSSAAMLLHDTEHAAAIFRESFEGPFRGCDLRGSHISVPTEYRRQRAANGPCCVAVVGDPEPHEQRTEVCITEA